MNTAYQIASLRAEAEDAEAISHGLWADIYELEGDVEKAHRYRGYMEQARARANNHRIDAAALGPNLAESGNQQQ